MKIINQLILTIVMSAILGSTLSYCEEQSDQEQQQQMKSQAMAKIFDQLNLTEDQMKLLEANKKAQREQMKDSFEQMKSLRQELKQELMKPELDMNTINDINSKLKTLQALTSDNRINSILEVRKILTPEQFGQFLSKMEERRQKWMDKGEHESSKGQ